MRPRVASCHGFLLLLNHLITRGLSADQRKHDFGYLNPGQLLIPYNRRTLSGSPNLLMDTMMKKYSYPKSEVTAGVGYGHHLHPFYYQGQKEKMYPCAVECGEWETMSMDDNANDASSNVDVVTVHPDVSSIDITTTKSRRYKDASVLRPKKYHSTTTAATPTKNSMSNPFLYQDSKGADVKIVPQKSHNVFLEKSNTDKDQIPNDGSLYSKYYDALVSGYDAETTTTESILNKDEYFDPVEESIKYNPPSFIDAESDDIEAPVYPTKKKSPRERVEEKYVKHNLREERLEDVRTNSFGPYEEEEDYSADSTPGKQSGDYNPSKYIDDYAAPITPYHGSNEDYEADQYSGRFSGSNGGKSYRPSPPQGFHNGEHRPPPHLRGANERLRPFHDPRNNIPQQNGYSDYQGEDYDEPPPKSGPYLVPTSYGNKPGRYYGKNYPRGRVPDPRLIRRPSGYGRNRKYPQITNGVGNPQRSPYLSSENLNHPGKEQFPSKPYYGPGNSYHPYAPRHGYSPQSQEFPGRFSSGGIRVVSPPRIRAQTSRHGKFPHHIPKVDYRNSPYVRGQRVSYRQTIPQRDGFTKIVKKYKSVVNHIPQRYVGSG